MFLKKIRSKLGSRKYNTSVRSNHDSGDITNRNPTPHSPPTARVLSATPSQQPTRNERRDLWREALELLDDRSQESLRIRGMSAGNSVPMEGQLEALKREAERQCERCKGKEWKVSIGRYEIPVRQTTIQIISWVIKIGDVAGEFPPAPGRGVWAVVRSLLEEVNNFDREKVALLSVIDKITSALFGAQVYYEIYTVERIGKQEIVDQLYNAIMKLYSCILDLLVKSSDLSSNTALQFCRAVFDVEKPSDLLLRLKEQEQNLAKVAEVCEGMAQARTEVRLQGYLRDAQISLNEVTDNIEHVFEWVEDQERRELLQWVSKVQYGRHFQDIERKRSPNTGEWLVNHDMFHEWLNSPISSVIWLQGSPGTGKTFLSCAVIKHLMGTEESQPEGFAYFFCNRDEDSRRRSLPILQSLVRQLATPKNKAERVRKGLQLAREKALDNGSDLGPEECQDQIVESFDLFSRTIIILDALDEVIDEELNRLMKTLDTAISKTTRKAMLFIASRPETRINLRYKLSPTIKIQAEDNIKDIERHVNKRLDEFGEDYPGTDVSLMADHIRQTILSKCDNMFLWADLQMRQIFRCRTSDAVLEMLENLPRGLEDTYKQLHTEILDHAPSERAIAERALKWVLSSPRLLTSAELLSAVRMVIEDEKIKLKSPLQSETLNSICENLLVVDSNDEWRFFHLSAREYFESIEYEKEQGNSHCAQICLLYLMQVFDPQVPFEPVELHSAISFVHEVTDDLQPQNDPFDIKHPFFDHAQTFWPFYIQGQLDTDQSVAILKRFLGSPNESSTFFCRWHAQLFVSPLPVLFEFGPQSQPIELGARDLEPKGTPMFAITLLPLHKILRKWCEHSDFDPCLKNRSGRSLLSITAAAGDVAFCEILVSKGACVNEVIYGQDGSALAAACRKGKLEAVKYLLEAGADANLLLEVGRYGSALATSVLAPSQNMRIIECLIQAGADVNLVLHTGKYGSALATAAQRGYLEVVKYLVDSGADVNLLLPEHSYGSALAAATTAPRQALEIVRYLIGAGADVNLALTGGYHGNALIAAARGPRGNFEVIRYLVDSGADVNQISKVGWSGSPLAAAASRPTETLEITKYFLTNGADLNLAIPTGDYGIALIAAICRQDMATIKYLVTSGADVNILPKAGYFGSALAAAVAQRDLGLIKYLVEVGADVNSVLYVGDYGSALAKATCVFGNSLQIVEYLVEEGGADPNMVLVTGKYSSALATAEMEGKLAVIEYLRRKQVNSR